MVAMKAPTIIQYLNLNKLHVSFGPQVYYIAKKCSQRCTAEEYASALARHLVETYSKVCHNCLDYFTPG